MRTSITIETIRQAAAKRGGLSSATDGQLRRWWSTLDETVRSAFADEPELSKESPSKSPSKSPTRPPEAEEKEHHDADTDQSE